MYHRSREKIAQNCRLKSDPSFYDDFFSEIYFQVQDTGKEWQCPICNKVLRSKNPNKTKNYHLQSHEAPRFTCDFCGKKFKKKMGLEAHVNVHKGIFEHKCEPCNMVSFLVL